VIGVGTVPLELLASLGVFVGGVSFGFAGFAFALFATSGLSLIAPPNAAIPAVMLISDTLAIPLLWLHRRYITVQHLRTMPPFAPGALLWLVAGVAFGAFLLGHVPATLGRLAIACAVLIFVGIQLINRQAESRPQSAIAWWSRPTSVSFAGGALDGWLGSGGIIVVMFVAARRIAPQVFVGTILAYFLTSDVIRAASYLMLGYWTLTAFSLYLHIAPIAIAGYFSGLLLRRILHSDKAFRVAVLALLTVYAMALVVRTLASSA